MTKIYGMILRAGPGGSWKGHEQRRFGPRTSEHFLIAG
jgi:hypothetical protein